MLARWKCAWSGLLAEGTDQCIEQGARNLNDLGRGVVVLLELDQISRLFIEVDRGRRVAVVLSLLEDCAGSIAVHSRLSSQGADTLDELTVTIGEAEARARHIVID